MWLEEIQPFLNYLYLWDLDLVGIPCWDLSLFFLLLLFPPYHFSRALFFFFRKCLWDFKILESGLSFSFIMGWKNEFFTDSDFIIRNPKKIGCVPCFFRIIEYKHPLKHTFSGEKHFGLRNPNCMSTNSEFVCNLDN